MFAGVSEDFLCLGRFRLTFGADCLMLPALVCVCVRVNVRAHAREGVCKGGRGREIFFFS